MKDVFKPVGAYAMAQETASDWCSDRCGIEPVIADLFAVYYATQMTERTTKPWEWEDPADVWAEWCEELAGLGT